MLQAARFKMFEQVRGSSFHYAAPTLSANLQPSLRFIPVALYRATSPHPPPPLSPPPPPPPRQMFGRPVTGLWAALHLLLEVLPDNATDVLGYLSKVIRTPAVSHMLRP